MRLLALALLPKSEKPKRLERSLSIIEKDVTGQINMEIC
jgi:hypothetical protein